MAQARAFKTATMTISSVPNEPVSIDDSGPKVARCTLHTVSFPGLYFVRQPLERADHLSSRPAQRLLFEGCNAFEFRRRRLRSPRQRGHGSREAGANRRFLKPTQFAAMGESTREVNNFRAIYSKSKRSNGWNLISALLHPVRAKNIDFSMS